MGKGNGSSTLGQYLNGTSTLVRQQKHHVIVALPDGLPAAEMGQRLMNLERVLRDEVDPQAEVFLEPTQDRNRLRLLRGVTVS